MNRPQKGNSGVSFNDTLLIIYSFKFLAQDHLIYVYKYSAQHVIDNPRSFIKIKYSGCAPMCRKCRLHSNRQSKSSWWKDFLRFYSWQAEKILSPPSPLSKHVVTSAPATKQLRHEDFECPLLWRRHFPQIEVHSKYLTFRHLDNLCKIVNIPPRNFSTLFLLTRLWVCLRYFPAYCTVLQCLHFTQTNCK